MSIRPKVEASVDPKMDAAIRYRMATDRYSVLSDCLEVFLTDKRRFSANGNSQAPKIGYDEAFTEVNRKIGILRQMMAEVRTEGDEALITLGRNLSAAAAASPLSGEIRI